MYSQIDQQCRKDGLNMTIYTTGMITKLKIRTLLLMGFILFNVLMIVISAYGQVGNSTLTREKQLLELFNHTNLTPAEERQLFNDMLAEKYYRLQLIEKMENASCYEVWDPAVDTEQLENLLIGCNNRGLIK